MTINLLWTGGWDSTYRLLELVLAREAAVQPWYVSDPNRRSTAREIQAMEEIRAAIAKRGGGGRVLPTKFITMADIKPDATITAQYLELKRDFGLGSQYEWLAALGKTYGIENLELAIHAGDKFRRVLGDRVQKIETAVGPVFRFKETQGGRVPELFARFDFPILSLTKCEQQLLSARHGFSDILELSWFCHWPLNGLPCGQCAPCIYTIEEGMGRRLPWIAHLRYHALVPLRRWKNQLRSCGLPAPVKRLYRALIGLLPDEWAIQIAYLRKFKRFANLRAPRTFNEKINWRKLHQRDPRFTLFADKAAVKDEIARMVGREHVIPTLWTGERPEDIPFDALTPPYVIKVNHGYGSNIFIRHQDDLEEKRRLRAVLHELLRNSHGRAGLEWAYYGIPRKIIIERMLDIFGDGIPEDYKFFVYHGRVHFIQIDVDRWGNGKRAFYDPSWNKLPMTKGRPDIERPIPEPSNLQKMIEIAEKIGSIFDFVRVDLYCASNKVFFGETTFYPGEGFSKMSPGIWDYKFGEPWRNLSSIAE